MTTRNSFDIYRKKRVLITGLTGFKGQWLGKWLENLGAHVVGLGLPPIPDPLGNVPNVSAHFDCPTIDVRDRQAVAQFVQRTQPEIIFHLAAQPLVRASYKDPVETFATNVMGTAHVLDAARQTPGVQAVLNVTSDKCYENREWYWAYREDEPLGGHDPYSASKGCSEIVSASFRRSYATEQHHLLIATARAGNVIGGADWSEDRLLPDIVRALLADQPIVLRRPAAIRPWQHVIEALSGYLLLGAHLLQGNRACAKAWNFGPPETDAVCVGDLARRVVQTWGTGQIIESPHDSGPHEARYLKLDSSLAKAELPWEPLLSMSERLQWTVEWYQQWNHNPTGSWQFINQQIECYAARFNQWLDRNESSSAASQALSAPPSRAA